MIVAVNDPAVEGPIECDQGQCCGLEIQALQRAREVRSVSFECMFRFPCHGRLHTLCVITDMHFAMLL